MRNKNYLNNFSELKKQNVEEVASTLNTIYEELLKRT